MGNIQLTRGIENMRVSLIPSRLMNRFLRSVYSTLALAVLLFAGSAYAQTPRPTPPSDDDGGQLKTFEVRLPVTVTLKKELVTGLGRGDFAVFEDGVQQDIVQFESAAAPFDPDKTC